MASIKEALAIALAESVKELEAGEFEFALVGGLAVGVRADPRVTRNIDFVIPTDDNAHAEATVFAQQRGFLVESVFVRDDGRISTVRARGANTPRVMIDFLLSNARIEREIVEAASLEDVVPGTRCPVAQPWHLLAMKVYANRPKDQPDLQALVEASVGKSGAKTEAALRLMQRRGVAAGRNLIDELKELRRRTRASATERRAPRSISERILLRNQRR